MDAARLQLASYPFVLQQIPRYADLDILQQLSTLALGRYLEEVRIRFLLDRLGEDFLYRPRDYRLLVAHAHYSYLHAACYDRPVKAAVGVTHLGRSSFELAMALFQEATCVCLAEVTGVVVNHQGAMNLPAEIRETFTAAALRGSAFASEENLP